MRITLERPLAMNGWVNRSPSIIIKMNISGFSVNAAGLFYAHAQFIDSPSQDVPVFQFRLWSSRRDRLICQWTKRLRQRRNA